MSKKYIIEIEDAPVTKDGVKLWKACGFNSLVFDEEGLKRLTEHKEEDDQRIYNTGFEHGAKTATDAIKWLFRHVPDEDIFDGNYVEDILILNPIKDIVDFISNYKYSKIEVGDEVLFDGDKRAVVLDIDNEINKYNVYDDVIYFLLDEHGILVGKYRKNLKKTGRKFTEIKQLIERLRNPYDCETAN